jgi:hypothetical protein
MLEVPILSTSTKFRFNKNKTSSLLFPDAPWQLDGKLILKTKEVSRKGAKKEHQKT